MKRIDTEFSAKFQFAGQLNKTDMHSLISVSFREAVPTDLGVSLVQQALF